MKNKGFTLIELLAVIVILAIIALIATPIILGIINNAKDESNERSVELYANSIKNAIARYQLNGGEAITGNYSSETLEDKIIIDYDGSVNCKNIELSANGKVMLSGCTVNNSVKEYNYGIVETLKQETGCTYTDEDSSGTINLSDIVTCGTESFYVMSTDEIDPTSKTVTMYAVHNLNVGDNKYPNEATYGIQDENCDDSPIYGNLAFSTTDYWSTESYQQRKFVYGDYKDQNGNQQNLIYPYVEEYETYLKDNGVASAEATIISYTQINLIPSSTKWRYTPSSWSGSLCNVTAVSSGGLCLSYDAVNFYTGVRPVVTISMDEIK